MKKMKRYNGKDDSVTSEDSNAGMKEAYDEGALERANSSAESQSIANEAKGDAMLKAMRDEGAKPKMAKSKATANATSKTSDYSNEGRSTPAPTAKRDVTKMSLAERAKEDRETAIEKYGQLNKDIEARKQSSITNPSLLSRLFSVGSQRDRKYKSENMASGGMASSASKRADGIASRGKTRGKMC
jgi:hypothetical protein